MKNDGAVLLLIMGKTVSGIRIRFRHGLLFKDGVTVGVDSNFPGIGPVPAISNLLKQTINHRKY
ncbi:hypothetical protein ACVNP0_02035 [Staphylococcus aureus]